MSANGIGDLESLHRSSKKRKVDEDPYPDASNWSMDEVAEFFRGKGFTDQASAFIEQEIDGKSLLLMKRNDVLTGLSIKLGPALKIYEHVQKLQIACC